MDLFNNDHIFEPRKSHIYEPNISLIWLISLMFNYAEAWLLTIVIVNNQLEVSMGFCEKKTKASMQT